MTTEPAGPKQGSAPVERNAHSLELSSEVQVDSAIPVDAGDSDAMNIISNHGLANNLAQKDPPSSSWSWWSNLFFLLGSLMYVVRASIAIHIDSQTYSSNASQLPTASPSTFYDDGSKDQPRWWTISYYELVGATAALWLFGNAVIDLGWAVDDRRHQRLARFGGDDPRWDIGLAVTFGVAASCDFFACVLANYQHTFPSIVCAIAAVHIYLVYALVALSGRTLTFSSLDQCFTSAGDVLFLFGSIIDVVLSYFLTKATTQDTWRMLDFASMVSALLWTGNAVLCIAADAVSDRQEKRRSDDPFVIMTGSTDHSAQVDLTGRLS